VDNGSAEDFTFPMLYHRPSRVAELSNPSSESMSMPLSSRSGSGKSRLRRAARRTWFRKRVSSFCPARFYGATVFFVEGEERSKRNEDV
jgi:hypothetical protein